MKIKGAAQQEQGASVSVRLHVKKLKYLIQNMFESYPCQQMFLATSRINQQVLLRHRSRCLQLHREFKKNEARYSMMQQKGGQQVNIEARSKQRKKEKQIIMNLSNGLEQRQGDHAPPPTKFLLYTSFQGLSLFDVYVSFKFSYYSEHMAPLSILSVPNLHFLVKMPLIICVRVK